MATHGAALDIYDDDHGEVVEVRTDQHLIEPVGGITIDLCDVEKLGHTSQRQRDRFGVRPDIDDCLSGRRHVPHRSREAVQELGFGQQAGRRHHSPLVKFSVTVTLVPVTQDLGRQELDLKQANLMMTKAGWIVSPRTKNSLMNLRDGLGNLVYAPQMAQGRLRGNPFKATTQVSNALQGAPAPKPPDLRRSLSIRRLSMSCSLITTATDLDSDPERL